ncbi:MAG TPA: phage holin family protein [Candidatus Limnocylindrales bacterium]|jgi:fatty acid desaturase|nr:phage holin family protein [Candidatus Limnocylindrales bacterium]
MTPGDAPRRANPITLVKRMISGGVSLAKLEMQHAKQEMGRNLGQLKGGILMLAIAAALALVFLIALVGFVMAVLVVIGLWWVALILLVLLLVGIGLLAWRGIAKVTSTKFTPEETIASVKEEMEWAKTRLLRRG